MEILNKVRNLDAYPKINEDFYSRTLAIFLLSLSEFRLYLNSGTDTKLTVYTSRGDQLRINRHEIIKKMIDSHGNVIESRTDGIGATKIERPLQRHGGRLDHYETSCGSCFGAEAESLRSPELLMRCYTMVTVQSRRWKLENTDSTLSTNGPHKTNFVFLAMQKLTWVGNWIIYLVCTLYG